MKKRILLLGIGMLLGVWTVNAEDELNIVPRPKQITVQGRVQLAVDTVIVTDGTVKSQSGAEEINAAVVELGFAPFQVRTENEVGKDGDAVSLILIGSIDKNRQIRKYCEANKIEFTPENPGEQGYVVRFLSENGRSLVLIAGSDELGALYGCVTFRYLLRKNGTQLEALKADIRDWPDLKNRQVGDLSLSYLRQHWYAKSSDPQWKEKHYELMKDYILFCMRHKINMCGNFMVAGPRFPDWDPSDLAWMKDIYRYAEDHGVRVVHYDSRAVYLGDKIANMEKNPDVKRTLPPSVFKNWDCGTDHDMYFCWSKEDLHRKQAQAYAEAYKMYPHPYVWFHLLDAPPSGSWVMRCKGCKKKFGNNRAAADAAIANLYYDEVRKVNPNADIAFTFWPYSAEYVVKYPDMEAYHREVASLIPKDAAVLLREGKSENNAKFREIYKGHPIYFYIEDGGTDASISHSSTVGFFSPLITQVKTFSGDPRDVIFLSTTGDATGVRIFKELVAEECAWNINTPGSSLFNGTWDFLKAGKVPHGMEGVVERIVKNLWGDEAGKNLACIFTGDINAHFICRPEEVLKFEDKARQNVGQQEIGRTKLGSQLMEEQAQATGKALQAMAQVLKSGVKVTPENQKYFTHYYEALSFLNNYAIVNAHYLKAKELAIAGKMQEASAEIDAGLAAVDAGKGNLGQTLQDVRGKPDCYPQSFRVAAEAGVDLNNAQARLERLRSEKESLYKQFNVPEDIKSLVTSFRKIEVPKVDRPPALNGSLDDAIWQKAARLENFCCYDQLKLPEAQTTALVCYDDKNLYLGFECVDPQMDRVKEVKRDRDSWENKDDVVEIFLAPDENPSAYSHLTFSFGGVKYDNDLRPMILGGIEGRDEKVDWNPEWTVAVAPGKDRWTAVAAIPFAELATAPYSKFQSPLPGTVWRANFCRDWHNKETGKTESSSLQYRIGEGFHCPAKFSYLIFK